MAQFIEVSNGHAKTFINLDHVVAIEEASGGVFLTASKPFSSREERFPISAEDWAVLKHLLPAIRSPSKSPPA